MPSTAGDPAAAGVPDSSAHSGSSEQPASAEAEMMDRFLSDYLTLMPGRVAMIDDFIERQRHEEARVAILSLESASGMLGERTLRSLLHDLRIELDTCSAERRHDLTVAVHAEAESVRQRLSAS